MFSVIFFLLASFLPNAVVSEKRTLPEFSEAFKRENAQKNTEWLEANAKKDGVVVLESGLQYKIVQNGTGRFRPKPSAEVELVFEGTTLDGKLFDRAPDRGNPRTMTVNRMFDPWKEAFQLMVEGEVRMLYVPAKLAYGDKGFAGSETDVKPGDTIIFRIELLKILSGGKVRAKNCDIDTKAECNDDELKVLTAFQGKSVSDIQAEIKRVDTKLDGMLKQPERLALQDQKRTLKALHKKAKQNKEL